MRRDPGEEAVADHPERVIEKDDGRRLSPIGSEELTNEGTEGLGTRGTAPHGGGRPCGLDGLTEGRQQADRSLADPLDLKESLALGAQNGTDRAKAVEEGVCRRIGITARDRIKQKELKDVMRCKIQKPGGEEAAAQPGTVVLMRIMYGLGHSSLLSFFSIIPDGRRKVKRRAGPRRGSYARLLVK